MKASRGLFIALFIIIAIVAWGAVGYFVMVELVDVNLFSYKDQIALEEDQTIRAGEISGNYKRQVQETQDNNDNKEPAHLEKAANENGGKYIEKLPVIEGEQAYIAFPVKMDPAEESPLVIFSHGSTDVVEGNYDSDFMKQMQDYGKFSVERGYVFAASNEHGENFGSVASIKDMERMINWIKSDYMVEDKIYLIGFSMGGLPTLGFAEQFSPRVAKIALLAPVTPPSLNWEVMKDIPMKIWHGDLDTNVVLGLSQGFVAQGKSYGREVALGIIPGATHFEVDDEYKEEIFTFFQGDDNINDNES